jgi:hypothetical protein
MTGEGDNKMRTAPSIRPGNEEEQALRATATGADCAGVHQMAQSTPQSHPDRRATLGAALIERAAF